MKKILGVRILSGNLDIPADGQLKTLYSAHGLTIQCSELFHKWESPLGEKYFFFGDNFIIRSHNGAPYGSSLKSALEGISYESFRREIEGRYILVRLYKDECKINSDSNGAAEVYWQKLDGAYIIASSLEFLPISENGGGVGRGWPYTFIDCLWCKASKTTYSI